MQTPLPDTLWPILLAHSQQRASAVALRFEGQDIHYGELHAQAQAFGAALQGRGVQRGDRVAWLGLNHPRQIALLWACAGIGAIAMPLNYRLALPELERILRDGTPALLLHDALWQDSALALSANC